MSSSSLTWRSLAHAGRQAGALADLKLSTFPPRTSGNYVAAGISVAVSVKLSVFMNRICEPTATVETSGA